MKTKNYFGVSTKIIFSLLALALFVASCKKDFGNSEVEASGLGFVHASPTTKALDFFIDNQKVNTLTYTKDLGYYAVFPGTRVVGIARKDSLGYLSSGYANLNSGGFYSIFIVDTLNTVKLVMFQDDLKAPSAEKAKVRFINLSPDAGTLDLAVQGASTSLFTSKAYKQKSDFAEIDPSDNYTFQIKQTGSATVRSSVSAVKIEKGKIYTIWAKGLASKTDSTQLGIAVMTNK